MIRLGGLVATFVAIWFLGVAASNVSWFRELPLGLGFPTFLSIVAVLVLVGFVGFAALVIGGGKFED